MADLLEKCLQLKISDLSGVVSVAILIWINGTVTDISVTNGMCEYTLSVLLLLIKKKKLIIMHAALVMPF